LGLFLHKDTKIFLLFKTQHTPKLRRTTNSTNYTNKLKKITTEDTEKNRTHREHRDIPHFLKLCLFKTHLITPQNSYILTRMSADLKYLFCCLKIKNNADVSGNPCLSACPVGRNDRTRVQICGKKSCCFTKMKDGGGWVILC